MALDLRKSSRVANAVQQTMRSKAWARAMFNYAEREFLLIAAIHDALCPILPRWKAVQKELLLRQRNREIAEEFDGRNHKAIARKFQLSNRQVRRIVDEVRASARTRLPPLGDA